MVVSFEDKKGTEKKEENQEGKEEQRNEQTEKGTRKEGRIFGKIARRRKAGTREEKKGARRGSHLA